jgi:hypothetical protein
MVLPVIDLIVPTALTLDFSAVVGWAPSFCATAAGWDTANIATQTTTTNTFMVAMGLRIGVMPDIRANNNLNTPVVARLLRKHKFCKPLMGKQNRGVLSIRRTGSHGISCARAGDLNLESAQ